MSAIHHRVGLVLILLALAGCGSTPPPREEVAAADVAVREAEEARAAVYAEATLRDARQHLERAETAMRGEEYTTARREAEKAEVLAQRAEAESRSELAQENVAELRESIDLLRRELVERDRPSS